MWFRVTAYLHQLQNRQRIQSGIFYSLSQRITSVIVRAWRWPILRNQALRIAGFCCSVVRDASNAQELSLRRLVSEGSRWRSSSFGQLQAKKHVVPMTKGGHLKVAGQMSMEIPRYRLTLSGAIVVLQLNL